MTFHDKLNKCIQRNSSLVCVGLDTDLDKIPTILKQKDYSIFEFNKEIINATHDLVCAYKPNSAFYEALGDRGITQLKMTCDYLKEKYPEIPIILDAKRADIGNTNNGYTKYAYEYLGVDAITLNPYLGKNALQPFLNLKEKGCIILCKTSNSGAGEFQDLKVFPTDSNSQGLRHLGGGRLKQSGTHDSPQVEGAVKPLYKIVAQKVAQEWNNLNNCLLVVGATYPQELSEIRRIVGDMTILVPGIGTQGGDLEKTIRAGLNSKKTGLIINSSRDIIYASSSEDFAEKAREETQKLKNEINKYRH